MLDILTARPTIILGGTLVGALVLAWVLARLLFLLSGRTQHAWLRQVQEQCGHAWRATLVSVGELAAIPGAGLPERFEGPVRHLFLVATISSVSWLAAKAIFLAEDTVLRRLALDGRDKRKALKVRTQLSTVRRLTAVVIALVAIAAILMTFDAMRTYGASVLASAGLVGVVAGLAAQTMLGNVFAGLQLVFTDALRYDDIVVVEGEWGRIEELTLTYVVVHLWDERRLVLPATYFTTTPFENWTRSESRVLAVVELHLDPTTPVAELRAHTRGLVEANPLWDQRDWVLQVTGMTEMTMLVRVTASAADASSAWDLRCDLREQLLGWLQREHPTALPRIRTEGSDQLESWSAFARVDA